jgi:hypothetical protein
LAEAKSLPPFTDVEFAMPEPTWQELYKAALLELDPEKLNQRCKAARRAVHQRLNAEDETTTHEEHDKLDDALRMLYVLTRGSGIA